MIKPPGIGILGRFPQFLNWVLYELIRHKDSPVLRYEPLHLHIMVPNPSNEGFKIWQGQVLDNRGTALTEIPKTLDLESFQFVIHQVPTVQTVEFSGWGEPLRIPRILEMVHYAHQFNGAVSTVHSHGLFGSEIYRDLITSRIQTLVINMIAHKPSAYAAITGRHASHFLTLEKNIEQFLLVRSHYPDPKPRVELSMTVDIMNLFQIPEMIRYAERLGADGIRFDNFLGAQPEQLSMETLFTHYKKAQQFLAGLQEKDYAIQVTLPVLLDKEMSHHRHCQDPHTTVSLTEELRISPCSRHLVFQELEDSIWDGGFWNNLQYQWLRTVHTPSSPGNPKSENGGDPIPASCRHCPRNLPHKPRILNDRTLQQDKSNEASPLRKSALWSF